MNDAHFMNADTLNLINCFEVSAIYCHAWKFTYTDNERAAQLVLLDPIWVVARWLAGVRHGMRLEGLRLHPKDWS